MILLDQQGGIARLTLDRPAQRNALATDDWRTLAETIATVPQDAGVVLLRSSMPGIFCAGADLRDLARLADEPERRAPFRLAMRAAIDALAALPMPVVATIDGGCFGAGVALALAADLRVASAAAAFAVPPARLGIAYPAEDVARLAARVGEAQAARLLFTAATIDADEALRIGLIDLIGDGAAVAEAIATNDSTALATLKAMLRDPAGRRHAAAFEDSFANPRFAAATQRYR
ncbi:enoyl-CoA hydratase/isomerase family protein [Sphingomonas radiodurans]|uniref:enoyl-CoA hydratase/isomerase family protein n=1 Tax=Sphingomonas radiodurans TaxID=2890321 RepID=UPI001E5159BB|nr:enoyl-CoA hydratase/isomerase family protein [Sphingomonas radiodurans]WBH15900.1 enoyl-CoA hydratase/isomerase family protein [Sphingomonas radiodurans]